MRTAMPLVAEMVDELRAVFGAAVVNRCISRGQAARREHARIQSTLGQQQADAWLAWQLRQGGWFHATEGGHTVGIRGPA